jgi:urea-proton symporter
MTTTLISQDSAYLVIAGYAAAMIGTVWLFTSVGRHVKDHYFVADRRVGVLPAAASIAVSWIWAPAIFFAGLKAYSDGIAGAFWFIVPNVLCFTTFALVVRQMRKQFPDFYTLPDYMLRRFPGYASAHVASLIVAMIIEIVALLFNSFVGAFLLNMLTGIPTSEGTGILLFIAVIYSVWRGFPASVTTDVVQLIVIVVIAGILVPWIAVASSHTGSILGGFGGAHGQIKSIFDPDVVYSFGIPATLALLAVPLADQMFYHRAVSIPSSQIVKTFVIGGFMFGIVPLLLSIPGFIGASLELHNGLTHTGLPPLFVSVDVLAQFLPIWTLYAFTILAIFALSSTIDSALVGLSLIWTQDIFGRYLQPHASEQRAVDQGRIAIVVAAALAYLLARLLQDYLSGDVLFNFNGAVASTIVGPLILAVFFRHTSPMAIVISVIVGLIIAIPGALWANHGYYVLNQKDMVSYVVTVAAGVPILTTCLTLLLSLVFRSRAVPRAAS